MCRLNSTPPGAAQAQPLLPCLVLLAGWLRSVRGATLGVVEPEAPGVGPHVGRRPSVRWPVWRPDAIRIMRREVGQREGEAKGGGATLLHMNTTGEGKTITTQHAIRRLAARSKSSQVKSRCTTYRRKATRFQGTKRLRPAAKQAGSTGARRHPRECHTTRCVGVVLVVLVVATPSGHSGLLYQPRKRRGTNNRRLHATGTRALGGCCGA